MFWGFPHALLFLAGAVPLIVFLHSLKPKGIKLDTTTLFLWERVLNEQPLATRLGWLVRKNLLLILQIVAATMLIAALADPALRHFGALSGDTVVVMDLSASMKARGSSGPRFEAARREFFSLIDGLRSHQRIMVIGAGAQPRILQPFTADKRRLRQLAQNISATDAPGRIKEAILFAHAFLKRDTPDRVVVISDGAFEGAEEYSRPADHLRFIKIEGGNNNIGIVGFELRRHPERRSQVEVMVHVKNFTASPARVPLTLALGEKVLMKEFVEMEPDGRQILIYPLENSPTATLVARLEIDDDFATDNVAYLAFNDEPRVRLLYVGAGNPFLSNLFRFFPYLQVNTAREWDPNAASTQYDVVVLDNVPAPPLVQGNFILINTVAANLPLRVNGAVKSPRIVSQATKHSMTEGVSLSGLHVRKSLLLALSGEASVLARSPESPLIVAIETGKLRALVIGFDLMDSDLPLRVAFPVLVHNALEWFQPQQLEFPGRRTQSGSPIPLPIPASEGDVELTTPSGRKEILSPATNPLIFADTFEAGLYTYKKSGAESRFAVNLLDESESQIASHANVGNTAAEAANQMNQKLAASFPLWPVLLILALLVLAVELALAFRSGMPLLPLAIRAAALAALMLAVLNPKIFQSATALDVVLDVDLSRSVGQEAREKAQDVLEVVRRSRTPETRTGMVVFGGAPEWEFLPRENLPAADAALRLDREQTDIQAALQASLAQIGEGRQGKILLISDGNENRGEISRIIPLLRSNGTQVWTLPVSLSQGRNEVFLSDLASPGQVDSGEGFEIAGKIESLRDAAARIKLLRDGVLIRDQEIQLRSGTNQVRFRESLLERGNHSYELLLESRDDTLAENNLLQSVVEVKGAPRVLLLSGNNDSQQFLSKVLQVQGYSVVQSAPEKTPLTLTDLASFDLLVLDNVPAFQLTDAKMENIEKYVRDLGGGLLVIGGSQSYGAGGYYRTALERILPVDMRPPARLDLPHVALLFVLDKSGSMGAGQEGSTKLDLAKAAAVAAADIMNPTDQVGIIGFDAAWDWVLPFRPVGNGEWISEKLAALQSDGGTDLYKALVEAHRAIAAKQAAIKHVIVLSDGLTDKADFQGLGQRMARDGITVSTVSVGSDADVQLMADIAKEGKGRGYVALDPQTIPQIFTAETLLISRDLLVDKIFTPSIVAPVGPLKGISQASVPPLRGYVLTYPKPRSELLMSAEKDPLLASWRYGVGRVTAFTSDLSGRWGKEWVTWPGFPQWASQLARDSMRKFLETRMRTELQPDGEAVKVVADLLSKEGKFLNHLKLKSNIATPNKTTLEQALQQSAPGRYETKFIPSQRGIHLLTLYAEGEPGHAGQTVGTIPYIAPYPKEYRELKANTALLSRLAEETGGEMIDADKLDDGIARLYTPNPGKGRRGQETWWPLAGVGLGLFLVDLVMRSWPRRSGQIQT
jgi:Mg-chelatase subunit ChlD